MPLTSKGNKILANMRKQYGSEKKAKQVFYASRNKGTISGVDAAVSGYRINAADARARIARFVRDAALLTPRGVDQSGTGKYHFAGRPSHATGDLGFSGAPPGTDINAGVSGGPKITGIPPGTDINRSMLEMSHGPGGSGPGFPRPPSPETGYSGDAQDLPLQALMDRLSEKLMGKQPSYAATRDRFLGDAAIMRPPGPSRLSSQAPPQPNTTPQHPILKRLQQGARPPATDDASEGASFHERQAAHFAGRGQQEIAMRHTKAAALLHKAAAARLGGQVEAQRHTQAAAKVANPVVRPTGDSMPNSIPGQNPRFAHTFDRWMSAPTRDQATIARFMDRHATRDQGMLSTPPTDMGSPTTSDYGVKGMKKGYHMHTPPKAAPRKAAKPVLTRKPKSSGGNAYMAKLRKFNMDSSAGDSAAVVTTRSADLPPPAAWARDRIAKFVAKRART